MARLAEHNWNTRLVTNAVHKTCIDVKTSHRYGALKSYVFTPMAKKTSYPFEKSLARLEELVAQMESSELSLEASLKTFEEGIKLTRECQQALKDAEQKVALLMEKNGEQPFEGD
tara:strand:- start:142 stop:486 length:345 start_codon:yes stop_codon:yes gene_type:complete